MAAAEEDAKSSTLDPIPHDVGNIEPSDKTLTNESDEEPFSRPVNGWKWILCCVGLYLGALLVGLDTTISADLQGPILESLGEIQKLAWVGIGFPMGSVAVILVVGTCYGLFEIKTFIITSTILFEIGSAICGAAPNMNAMICGRVIAGIGGAGMYLGLLNYISVFTSLKKRPLYMAGIGFCWGTGAIIGPLIGGGFSESSATWRWAFYINLPLAAATAPIYFILLPRHNPQPAMSLMVKLASIDWISAVFFAATFALFMVVLTFAGSSWAWDSSTIIILWVFFGVAFVSFALQSYFSFFTTNRLYPVHFLKSRTMVLLYLTTAAGATGLGITVYYIPLFFQFTKGDSAIHAAVRLLPFVALNIFFTLFSGVLLAVFGRYMPFYLAGGILMLVGGSLMYTVTASSAPATIYGYEILIAVGAGLVSQIGYSIAAAKVKASDASTAIGFLTVAQLGTLAITLSMAGALFQNLGYSYLKDVLVDYNFSEAELRAALAGARSAILAHSDQQVVELAIGAIVKIITKIFALIIAAGSLCAVCSVFMRGEKLDLTPGAGV